MSRAGFTHVLPADTADAYQRIAVDTAQTIALERDCVALILAASGQNVFCTFDDTTPSATNGIPIVQAAQPVFIPLGRVGCVNGNLKAIGAAAGGFLHVQQLA